MVNNIRKIIDELEKELRELSEYIYHNPEMGYKEYKSSKAHIDILKKYDFRVEEKYMGMDTAFRAEYDSGKPGPTISYLSEYDALPGVGHGCGHNLLGTTNTGAGIVLSKIIKKIGGKAIVFGTPAEETSGAKVEMADKGAFDDVDIAMVAHPGNEHYKSGESLALEAIEFTFKGKSSHAASNPDKGINALDAAINTFNNINALREHVKPSARIHGIITEGGKAANIVPDLAIAQFYVRATTKEYLMELSERVKNCARGASLAAGTTLEMRNYEASYYNLITNKVLSNIYTDKLQQPGVENISDPKQSYGSLDAGNVSHRCPTIHPFFSISSKEIVAHTKEFAEATLTEEAYDSMKKTMEALVLTAVEVIDNPETLRKIKDEFEKATK